MNDLPWEVCYIAGFEAGLVADDNISRIEAFNTLPVPYHANIDDYLNGHDDAMQQNWFRYNLICRA